jgi:hypothetical protein
MQKDKGPTDRTPMGRLPRDPGIPPTGKQPTLARTRAEKSDIAPMALGKPPTGKQPTLSRTRAEKWDIVPMALGKPPMDSVKREAGSARKDKRLSDDRGTPLKE